MKNWVFFFAGVFFMALVGGGDYAEAKKDHLAYCKNVRDGIWPDYKKNFKESCKNDVDTKTE